MKKQQGFTLIELMIVVAVIGVLSAIAVPQYQKYVKKSGLGTALASVSAYKTQIEDDIAFSNEFPAISAAFGIGKINSTSSALAADNAVIAEVTSGSATGAKIKLTRNNTNNGEWKCTQNQNDIDLTGCTYENF